MGYGIWRKGYRTGEGIVSLGNVLGNWGYKVGKGVARLGNWLWDWGRSCEVGEVIVCFEEVLLGLEKKGRKRSKKKGLEVWRPYTSRSRLLPGSSGFEDLHYTDHGLGDLCAARQESRGNTDTWESPSNTLYNCCVCLHNWNLRQITLLAGSREIPNLVNLLRAKFK